MVFVAHQNLFSAMVFVDLWAAVRVVRTVAEQEMLRPTHAKRPHQLPGDLRAVGLEALALASRMSEPELPAQRAVLPGSAEEPCSEHSQKKAAESALARV
jgi:hypothetical protein